MVMVLPIYEEEQPGVYYNTAVVVDADGTILGTYRKHHIPNLDKFWEKFYFRPGNLGYPVFDTAVGPIGVYICYDRHFPEGWRELGLNGAQIVFNPNATKPGLSNRLWEIEQPAAAVANGYFVAAAQPGRPARTTSTATLAVNFYGTSQFVDPQGNFVGELGSATRTRSVAGPRPRHGHGPRRAQRLAVLPRPPARLLHRDRRSRDRSATTMSTTLITGGTVVSATGRDRAPTCSSTARRSRAVLAPGSTAARHRCRGIRRHRHRREPASTSSPAASTRTPTWSCRSAAPPPSTPSRPARAPPPGAAPRRSSTSRCSATASASRTGSPRGTRRRPATARSTTASTRSSAASTSSRSKAMERLIDEGITSFKLFMAYPGVFYSDDAQILQAMQKAARHSGC